MGLAGWRSGHICDMEFHGDVVSLLVVGCVDRIARSWNRGLAERYTNGVSLAGDIKTSYNDTGLSGPSASALYTIIARQTPSISSISARPTVPC